jgi:hypothetical protein
MTALTGQVYVPAPNPIVPRYGLFDVATGPLDLPVHARIGGLEYETATCKLPFPYEVKCQAELGSKDLTSTPTTVQGLPLVVYSAIRCSPVALANWGETRLRNFLHDQLVAGEQAVVERTFSTSSNGLANGLGGNPALVNIGGAVDVTRAVSKLEDWLYERYGLRGVIHASPRAAAYVTSQGHLAEKDSGGVWRTAMGTAVSFGNYAGSGPTGQAESDSETWIYITGQVAVWRTPDDELARVPMGQVLNRSTNEVTAVMEREYVVAFDCFVATVLTSLVCCG